MNSASAEKSSEAAQDLDAPRRVDFATVDTFEIAAPEEEGQVCISLDHPYSKFNVSRVICSYDPSSI